MEAGLFAWGLEVREWAELLNSIFLQKDRWVWKLHPTQCYTMNNAYYRLMEEVGTEFNNYNHLMDNKLLWRRVLPPAQCPKLYGWMWHEWGHKPFVYYL